MMLCPPSTYAVITMLLGRRQNWAVMGADGAVEIIHRRRLKTARNQIKNVQG